MIIGNLRSSSFYGGPERQMLEVARALAEGYTSLFLLFDESGRHRVFSDQIEQCGLSAVVLKQHLPHLGAMVREAAGVLRQQSIDVLCCHGYKADLVGVLAGRRVGIPVLAIAHGWTAQNFKVRVYEALDRYGMRWMDRVICVSQGQAVKVRRAGVPEPRIRVIRNAIRPDEFLEVDPAYRDKLRSLFPFEPVRIVGAAGRLSAEKGFSVLVAAAAIVARSRPDVGFVVFGDGAERESLTRQIHAEGLEERFILGGFRNDVGRFYAHMDVNVLPSFTEGLPCAALEAYAAGVPVVATAVGGNPEVVTDGVDGYLVPPGNPEALAARLLDMLADEDRRREMGQRGRQRVLEHFTVSVQEAAYRRVYDEVVGSRQPSPTDRVIL